MLGVDKRSRGATRDAASNGAGQQVTALSARSFDSPDDVGASLGGSEPGGSVSRHLSQHAHRSRHDQVRGQSPRAIAEWVRVGIWLVLC